MPEITAADRQRAPRTDRPAHDGLQAGLAAEPTATWKRRSNCSARRGRRRWRSVPAGSPRPGRIAVLCRLRRRRGSHDRPALRKRPGGQQRAVRRSWPTTWPGNWPRAPGPPTPEELLGAAVAQPAARRRCKQQFDDLNNRIREVFTLERIVRINGVCGGYAHHNGAVGVLLAGRGGQRRVGQGHLHARGGHAAHGRSARRTSIRRWWPRSGRSSPRPPARKASRKRSSPRWSKAACKTSTPNAACWSSPSSRTTSKTVGQVAKEAGMKIIRFVHWELPKE